MPRSGNHCVHRNATIRPIWVVLVVVVGVDVDVNNIKVSTVAIEPQKMFALCAFVELKNTS